MSIPIRNLYYLLLYAYDALDEAGVVEAGELPETRLGDLFAHVLDGGVNHLLRRGLDRGYVPHRDAIPGVRGRIDVSATVKASTLTRGRAVCEFDEFTADVTHNRILRATALRLLRLRDLDPTLHDRVAKVYRRLDGVSDVALSPRLFRSVQLYSSNRFYRYLLAVCRMVHDHLLADEATGEVRFRDFERDERGMRRLFERFIRTFYRREQSEFRVGTRRVLWAATGETTLLPTMQTDVTLCRPGRRIVIETKYTANQLREHFGARSIRSEHLYQLFAYLLNLARSRPGCRVEGVLLYPRASAGPDFRCELHGHPLRVTTINLGQDWRGIQSDLLALVRTPRTEPSATST
jgi:5-methylcytosine-specific restriction enzyme subunit McrC